MATPREASGERGSGLTILSIPSNRAHEAKRRAGSGASLKAVQELLGHESIEMTLRYSHLTPDARRSAVHLLDRAG